MKIEKEEDIIENTKDFDDRQQLERSISVACEDILDINPEMFQEEKVLRIGIIVYDLRKENAEFQKRAIPRTPVGKLKERRGAIEDIAAKIVENAKVVQTIAEHITKY